MHASIAIQKAIYEALIADSTLIDALGGAYVFDSVPVNQDLPFVQFGKLICQDLSTSTQNGDAHEIEILIWSCHKGRKQLLDLANQCEVIIAALNGVHDGHNIVNIHCTQTVTQYDVKSGNFKASLTYRCVTES